MRTRAQGARRREPVLLRREHVGRAMERDTARRLAVKSYAYAFSTREEGQRIGEKMARMSVGQKADRVLKLLLGLRKPRVVEALRQYGFTDADRLEGLRLLGALTEGRLGMRGPVTQDPSLLRRLDEWENRWFPITSASLKSRFPEVHEWLFLNLTQQEGAAVVLSVGTFMQRFGKMATEPSLGARGAEAVAFLEQRGFNASAVRAATELLTELGSAEPTDVLSEIDPVAASAAETAMWQWYLEWGEIARVAVRDRKLLRELGFLNYKAPDETEEGQAEDEQALNE